MKLPAIKFVGSLTEVTMGEATVWFSYNQPIAFKLGDHHRVVCRNSWSHTTAKHCNRLERNKAKHVSEEEFARMWEMYSDALIVP